MYSGKLELSIITPDKVYGFVYYQSYRTKNMRPKAEMGDISKNIILYRNDYNKVMDHEGERGIVDVVGSEVIRHYLCALIQHVSIHRR